MFMRRTVVVLILLAEMIGGGTAYGWYNKGWNYRQKITIQSGKVSGTLTNFPVLLTEANVQSGLWQHAQSNGLDLVVVQQDDTTRLSHEVERFDAAAQQMAVWVKLPVLSVATNLDFFIYYGSSVTNGLQDSYNLWTNFNVVVHLGAAIAGTNYDSTTNLNHALSRPISSSVTGNVSISTCESTNNWTWTGDTLTTNTTKKEGSYSICAIINSVVSNTPYYLTYDPPGTMDLSKRTMDFWQQPAFTYSASANHNFRDVYVYDINGNYRKFGIVYYQGNPGTWYHHWSAIDSGGTTNGVVDTTQINKIVWAWSMKSPVAGQSFTQYIDNVRAVGTLVQGVTGKIARAVAFEGGDANSMALSKSILFTTNTTISAWFKPLTTTGGLVVGTGYGQNPYPEVGIGLGASNSLTAFNDQYVRVNKKTSFSVAPRVTITNWHYVLLSCNSISNYSLYVDGVSKITSTLFDMSGSQDHISIGALYDLVGGEAIGPPAPGWDSIIDEVRIVPLTRSAEWVATEYNNQSVPATFAVPALETQFPLGTIIMLR